MKHAHAIDNGKFVVFFASVCLGNVTHDVQDALILGDKRKGIESANGRMHVYIISANVCRNVCMYVCMYVCMCV